MHDYNAKLPETFLWRKCHIVLVHYFFTAAHFLLVLVAASISHFVTAATKFSCFSSNKKNVSFVFLTLAIDLCRPFSRLVSLACRFSLFLCLSLALYSKLACSAGVFFERAICLRKRHFETSRREEEMGQVKGGGEREEKTSARKHCENEKHP